MNNKTDRKTSFKQTAKYTPESDGVDHINVYSNGRTILGRQLSNLAHTPFIHPEYGAFASIEGFWHWAGTGMQHESLRSMHGIAALKKGRTFTKVIIDNFEEIIKSAIEVKINTYPLLKLGLIKNKLPLTHYFVFKKPDAPDTIVHQGQFRWIGAHLEHYAGVLRKQ